MSMAHTPFTKALLHSRNIVAFIPALFGGACLTALLLLVVANVVARAAGIPFRGAVESSGVLNAMAAALGLAYAQVCGSHITGGAAAQRLPASWRRPLHGMACIAASVFFVFAAWELTDLAIFTLELGETQELIGDFYPWLMLMCAPGFAAQALVMALTSVLIFLRYED